MMQRLLIVALALLSPLSYAAEMRVFNCKSTEQYCVAAEYDEFIAQDHPTKVEVNYDLDGKHHHESYDVLLHGLTFVFTIDADLQPTNLSVTLISVNNTPLPSCTTKPVNVERQAVEKITIETEMLSGNHWCKFYVPNVF